MIDLHPVSSHAAMVSLPDPERVGYIGVEDTVPGPKNPRAHGDPLGKLDRGLGLAAQRRMRVDLLWGGRSDHGTSVGDPR